MNNLGLIYEGLGQGEGEGLGEGEGDRLFNVVCLSFKIYIIIKTVIINIPIAIYILVFLEICPKMFFMGILILTFIFIMMENLL